MALPSNSTTPSWNDRMESVRSALGKPKSFQSDWQWITTTRQEKYAVCCADIAIIASLVAIVILTYFGELLPILK